ncbi:MAG: hypothetical protein DCC75_11305 [Proteobacteria bacterium]|nr:MAG: hypothetical protein DCC75_11305 [Pseudomonadota bacterium]
MRSYTRPASHYLGQLLAVGVLYYLAGQLGLSLAYLHAQSSPVWPPTGIAITAVLICGYSIWPAVYIGAYTVNYTISNHVFSSLGIAAGNTLEALVGAYLVNRFAKGDLAFSAIRSTFAFVFLAGVLSTMISATIGVSSLALEGLVSWNKFSDVWLTWWLGDMAGAIIIAPFLISWLSGRGRTWNLQKLPEVILLSLLLLALGWLCLGQDMTGWVDRRTFAFLSVPPIIWAALRFGVRETVSGTLILSAISIASTLHGMGPFVTQSPNESLLLLQCYMMVLTITGLTLAANVSERDQALQRLTEANRKLSESNQNLSDFAHVVSHDLQEPLRIIANYSGLLKRDFSSRLNGDGAKFLEFMIDSAARMDSLLKDLVRYCRVTGESGPDLPAVSAQKILKEVLQTLEPEINAAKGQVTCETLPDIKMQEVHLFQILQNLISNAIKYRGHSPPAIRITCRALAESKVFCVSDNGIGIDHKFHQQIFGIFRRLHGQEYPGTGIGLAICKKIIARYRGTIWVESSPGSGSSFYFKLPDDLERFAKGDRLKTL